MTDETNDGGPAFPGETRTRAIKADGDFMTVSSEVLVAYHPGMSLRDWFAGQALAGMVVNTQLVTQGAILDTISASAYRIADAMLKAREARP